MKPLLVYFTVLASTLAISACDASSNGLHVGSNTNGRIVRDQDGDSDSPGYTRYDTDNDAVLTLGHVASTSDRQAIAVLIASYYRAAVNMDGAKACSLLYWLFVETLVEGHGDASQSSRQNATCAYVASRLFRQRHRELVDDTADLRIAAVRVDGRRGLALVRFGSIRERRVELHRDRGVWKMNDLLDAGAP